MNRTDFFGILGLTVIISVGFGSWLLFSQPKKCTAASCISKDSPQRIVSSQSVKNIYLIDVRTPQEYTAEHIEKAINLPINDIQKGSLPQVAKDTSIELYCRTGHRASIVKTILEQNGFTTVKNIGGLEDLKSQNIKTIKLNT